MGYILVSKLYKNVNEKLLITDSFGYYYHIKFLQVLNKSKLRIVDISNDYSIFNIKLWCKLNNKQLEILNNDYLGNDKYLLCKCLKESCPAQ